MRGGRLLREVDDVRRSPGLLESRRCGPSRGDRLLRLLRGRADVVRSDDAGSWKMGSSTDRSRGGLAREDVEAARSPSPDGPLERGLVHDLARDVLTKKEPASSQRKKVLADQLRCLRLQRDVTLTYVRRRAPGRWSRASRSGGCGPSGRSGSDSADDSCRRRGRADTSRTRSRPDRSGRGAPYSPFALRYSFLFQTPSCKSDVSRMRRSSARVSRTQAPRPRLRSCRAVGDRDAALRPVSPSIVL